MSLLYLQGLPASFTKINPEGVTECPEREIESYWSTRIATQITPELPLSSYSNFRVFTTKFPSPQEGEILTDSNILCYKDKTLQGLSNDLPQCNADVPFSREKFVPESAPIDSTQGLYQPLRSGHIRILELLPGHFLDDIQCRLHDAAIEQNKFAYEALSYTWELCDYTLRRERSHAGLNSEVRKDASVLFTCKGVAVPVQENLHQALRRMRDIQCSRYIWVDALCINQDDVTERAQQVQLMKLVYTYAHQVLIWLGESSSALRSLDQMSRLVHLWATEHGHDSTLQRSHHPQNAPQDMYDPLDMSALLPLYKCRWFHRLWVLQEVALARSAKVLYGQHKISWDHVGVAASILRTNYGVINKSLPREDRREIPTGLLNAYFMYRISRSQRLLKPLSFSFHQLLRITRQFNCKENRDKIFGLLAIPMTDNIAQKIVPDYNKSDAEIYRSIAWMLIDHSPSLDILSSVQHDTEQDKNEMLGLQPIDLDLSRTQLIGPKSCSPSLSSWVPQWHLTRTQALGPLEPDASFAASRGTIACISSSKNPSVLKVGGVTVDKVATMKNCRPDDFKVHILHPYGAASGQIIPPLKRRESLWAHYVHATRPGMLPIRPTTKADLHEIATTLTSGKSWHGLPVQDYGIHLAGFAKCLVEGLFRWTLNDDVFGGVSEPHKDEPLVSVDDLKSLSSTEDEMIQFRNAAIASCRGRTCFNTTSGLRGLGPAAMRPGDSVCVLYGATMPFVIRPEGSMYRLIGECYVHGLMRGEGVPEASADKENSWIELV